MGACESSASKQIKLDEKNAAANPNKGPILHVYCEEGKLHQVQTYLKKNRNDLNLKDAGGWTPLHCASQAGQVKVANFLLTLKPSLIEKNRDGFTALMLASSSGHHEIVDMLLKQNVNVDTQCKEGGTALMLASQNGHAECLKLLLTKTKTVDLRDKDGWTALMYASQNGKLEVMELLIEAKANVNTTGSDGLTALMLASHHGYNEAVDLLLERNAEVSSKKADGHTALTLATLNKQEGISIMLVTKGAQQSELLDDSIMKRKTPPGSGAVDPKLLLKSMTMRPTKRSQPKQGKLTSSSRPSIDGDPEEMRKKQVAHIAQLMAQYELKKENPGGVNLEGETEDTHEYDFITGEPVAVSADTKNSNATKKKKKRQSTNT